MINYLFKDFNNHSVFIYQMAKCGSTSIFETLKEIDKNNSSKIYHLHFIWQIKNIKENFLKSKFISLTRDLVARNISNFFQDIDSEFIHPDTHPFRPNLKHEWYVGNRDYLKKCKIEELLHHFYVKISEQKHLEACTWFEDHYFPITQIDVYSKKFNHDNGFVFFSNNHLVIKMENLNNCFSKSLSKLFSFKIKNQTISNRSKNKWYGEIYEKFCSFPVEKNYLKKIYDCRLMRHFYTNEEISYFTKKWLKC